MAAIVLAAAASQGAAALGAGTFFAAVAGGVGGYLGGFVDRSIFGGKARINQEGARLNDLMVQASSYGKAIPLVYGNARIAGNIIWSRPISEHVTTTTQSSGGGKGGGGGSVETTTTSYTYTASLAVAICEGPISEVVRVWADAKQLDLTQGNYTLYLGDETQLPDTYIASFFPAGQTPAYRGRAYVVIKDFPLGDFGNRIPNFTFEVRRTLKKAFDLEDKIKDITIIPGAGEYVYDTVVQEKQSGQQDVSGNFVQGGKVEKINQNNLSAKADTLVALDNLKANLPNVQWVAVVVNWFGDTLNPNTMVIKPAAEFNGQGARVTPDEWAVGSFTRTTAHVILTFPDGSPTYGGTPTDKSIVRLCQELKARGYNVLFYPMLQVDTVTPQAKPWRGRITPTSVTDVTNFFTSTNGYNAFINHYANLNVGGVLLKNNIDGFMIGSELVGLTQYMSSAGVFPAVTRLKTLAASVKSAVGSGVKVAYGGDWSEYHSVNGWYNLDPLWSDANIDVVGIDCYFPLTPDLPQTQIDYAAVYAGWTKDEGWDYYWDGARTTKTFYSGATYAWKNVKHWWNSTHTNPDASGTAWTAKMKPLWLTEVGFPSVDGCANQPNVFIDPDSVESFYPRVSRGRVDFLAQRTALDASMDYLTAQNTLEANLFARRFVWTWDARPFPFFPDLLSVWSDGGNWKTGHWVQGKLGLSNLGQIVADLLKKVGYDSNMVDITRLTDIVNGFVVTNRQTVRACLEQLAAAYFFDCVESDGLLKFVKRGKVSGTTVDFTELVPQDDGSIDTLTITRTQELELPRQVDVIYLNRTADYQAGTQSSQRQTVKAVDYATVNLPIVLTDQEAKVVADVSLYNAWVGRVQYQFSLPPKYALLEPSDVITITKDGAAYLMRLTGTKLVRSGMQDVTAVAEDVSSYDFYNPAGSTPPTIQPPSTISATRLELLDLPAFPTDGVTDANLRYGVVGLGDGWSGSAVYRSDDGGANYALMQTVTAQATLGAVLNIIPAGTIYAWDDITTIDVLLTFGELQSVTDLAVLNGANACVIANEVIQFGTATLLDTNKYRLSHLLRGRLGTEWAVTGHVAGERFVLLTNAVARELMASSGWGISKKYKPVTVGSTLGATTAQDFTYAARALKPYAPAHITGSRNGGGDLTLNWVRRTRLNGDWKDAVDVPLSEESERYEVDILSGVTLKRTITGLTTPTTIYTAAQQVTDFGSAQPSIMVNVYQLSTAVGRGFAGIATV
ncbi:MAG: glycoside hydrolase TIM-barrel-like domain-containing protein [Rickettsiales bacterium]|nr:glycoside hydrolase TIM-barrel-like domain-containing protein [Rickettsiales bacterium]